MRQLDVPAEFTLDLGYRKLTIAAGVRHFPSEIADHPKMARYALEPEAPAEIVAGKGKPPRSGAAT